MKKTIIIAISSVVCAFILGGSFLLVQINKQNSIEKQKLLEISQENKIKEQERLNKILKEEELDRCLSDALWSYHSRWTESCKESGIDKKTEGCSLPIYLAEIMDEYHQKLKDNCFKQYK